MTGEDRRERDQLAEACLKAGHSPAWYLGNATPAQWQAAYAAVDEGWRPEAATGFTCPRCGRTSYHPRDRAEGYCGACHDWTGEPRTGGTRGQVPGPGGLAGSPP
jgi:ribosomal protein L37E